MNNQSEIERLQRLLREEMRHQNSLSSLKRSYAWADQIRKQIRDLEKKDDEIKINYNKK